MNWIPYETPKLIENQWNITKKRPKQYEREGAREMACSSVCRRNICVCVCVSIGYAQFFSLSLQFCNIRNWGNPWEQTKFHHIAPNFNSVIFLQSKSIAQFSTFIWFFIFFLLFSFFFYFYTRLINIISTPFNSSRCDLLMCSSFRFCRITVNFFIIRLNILVV